MPNGTSESLSRLEDALESVSNKLGVWSDEVITLKARQEDQTRRLENMSTDFQRALTDVTTTFKNELKDVNIQIKQMSEGNKPNKALWISAASVFVAVIGGLIVLTNFWITADISQVIAPIVANIASLQTAVSPVHEIELSAKSSAVADADSRRDRDDLNRRVSVLETKVADGRAERQAQMASLVAHNAEIETQFKNTSQMLYMLWEKVTKMRVPLVQRENPS